MIAFSVSHQRLFLLLALLFGGSLNHSAHADTFGGYWKNRRAVGEYEKGKFEDSVRVFESAREADPDNSMIDFNHATALAKAKKDEDAIHHFGQTTKKALNDGDYATAAKSLYNEGLVHKQNQNFDEAFHQLTNAVEMAKISKQPDLEKKARQALLQASEQKQKKDQEKKDGGKGEGKDSDKKDQKKKEESPEENENGNRKQRPEEGKREFKSGTLSKEVAESIMNDLSDREKQLYQRKMKERKVREQQNEKDW
jgi:tetratricopeptide (TPR) repeat protein